MQQQKTDVFLKYHTTRQGNLLSEGQGHVGVNL